jgi:head-tail adaptor
MTPISTTLYDDTPTQLRGLSFLSLSDTCVVSRGTTVDNLGGGGTLSWSSVGTYACRIDPMGGREGEVANRVDERTTHKILLPKGTSVTAKDRILSGAGTYEVTAERVRTAEPIRVLEATENF